jgi:hypothetical protein
MNVQASVARLPENIRQLIAEHPSVSARLREGMTLHEVLASDHWAEEWASGTDELPRFVLKRLLFRFGSHAFDEEKGESEAVREGWITGAEWRAAMAYLRRCGVIFAVRKTWGERLFYIPDDMIPVWQRILLPVCAQPLSPEACGQVKRKMHPPRLSLPLEMLCVWSRIRQTGIALTTKGTISKPAAARLNQETRLGAEELAPLLLAYPQQDLLSPGVALALDLGLWTGVLRRGDKEIAALDSGLPDWMGQVMTEVNAAFYRLVMQRYASADPHLHLAASACAGLQTDVWYPDEVLTECGIEQEAAQNWLQLLTAFGWAERGTWQDSGCFRLLPDLAGLSGHTAAHREDEFQEDQYQEDESCYIIQPDGEILVPPQTRLTVRWFLEEIAERITADRMFVYRLTRKSCSKAFENGRSEQMVRQLLEQGSGACLPEPVAEAIAGWFRYFGRVRIVEDAVLLRADSAETAGRLLEDEELSSYISERIGERDFLADPGKLGALKKRLEFLGYAALVSRAGSMAGAQAGSFPADGSLAGVSLSGDALSVSLPAKGPASPSSRSAGESGWIVQPHGQLDIFRPDAAADTRETLFPGLSKVPSAWLARPGAYHPATRRQLIGQAIAWKAAVQVGSEEGASLFVPQSIQARGDLWEVQGYWKHSGSAKEQVISCEPPQLATLTAEEAAPIKIVLPPVEGIG